MASTGSTEASEIRRRGRQRLIGAVAIAVLLVVFVPMILDSEPRTTQPEPSLTIPPKDKVEPLPAPAKARSVPGAEATKAPDVVAKAPDTPPAKPDPVPAKAAPVEASPKAAAAPVATPAPVATAAPTPKLEGFAVQVGAFKDEEKLKQARAKLAVAGIPHYIERRNTSVGELTRLRAGPFPTREAAEKALATMKAASMNGQVVPLP